MSNEPYLDQFGMIVTKDGLGGYIEGGDENTSCPMLWEWLIVEQRVKSMLDIGCGEGHALSYFRERGCDVVGIDGIEQPDPSISQHDYRDSSWVPYDIATNKPARFDLAWSAEFVEHIEEPHIPNFMETFKCADLALITHAVPGQGGFHHVNCQPAEYWIDVFDQNGFDLDEPLTTITRLVAGNEKWSYYVATGLVFRNRQ